MRGQSALINELLLFILGIFIASFVAYEMSTMETRMQNITVMDHMKEISELVMTGIVKVTSSGENTSLILEMKSCYGCETYRIRAIGGKLVVSLFDDERINVTREIFNISASKVIIGDVTSSSRYIIITNNRTELAIRKWQGNWS